MKLTYAQKNVLRVIHDTGDHGLDRSVTNGTLCALQRRGLVRWEKKVTRFDHIPACAGLKVPHWFLTDAGRAALERDA